MSRKASARKASAQFRDKKKLKKSRMWVLFACFVIVRSESFEALKVRDAFVHSLEGFSRHAWGHDEIRPVSNRTNDSWGGFGCVLHDALDTALLMRLDEMAERIVRQIATVSFLKDWDAHVFEYTIRYLGSLVSAFQMRGRKDASLLASAEILGGRLLNAFDNQTGLPYGVVAYMCFFGFQKLRTKR